VRVDIYVRGSDQRSCAPVGPPVMITDHVAAVRLPADHACGIMAAALPARAGCKTAEILILRHPVRRPAATAAAPTEAELGRPGQPGRSS